jgi:hypothetical protein
MFRITLAIAAAGIAGLAASAPALAADRAVPAPLVPQSTQSIRAYWSTHEQAALPATMPAAKPGVTIQRGRPTGATRVLKTNAPTLRGSRPGTTRGVASSKASAGLSVISQGWLPSANYAIQKNVGRLYFTTPAGVAMLCSASVVSRDVILTAGHCAFTNSGVRGYNYNFRFVPSQQGNSHPYGDWVGGRPLVWQRWADGDFSQDYAFIKFGPGGLSGRLVGDVVGASFVLMNPPLNSNLYELGYPATGVFSSPGNLLWFCYSPYGGYRATGSGYTIGIGCKANGGTSGGPWFHAYNGSWNYVASVTSTCENPVIFCNDKVSGYATSLWGPYFNNATGDLYNKTQAL